MRRFVGVLIGATVATAAGCAGASAPADTGHGRLTACAAHALALRPGTGVVPMTGEHAVLYALVNRGRQTCTVRGYPQITLYDAGGRALPFRYADGGGAYVTSRKPATVGLPPAATAYVLVAKYRCDVGIVRDAVTIGLALSVGHDQMFAAREPTGVPGPSGLSYCRGGPLDPGQLVTVSPLEPTAQAASSLGLPPTSSQIGRPYTTATGDREAGRKASRSGAGRGQSRSGAAFLGRDKELLRPV